MPRNDRTDYVGIRLPTNLVSFIDRDVEVGNYSSKSDWIRCALEQFRSNRIKEIAITNNIPVEESSAVKKEPVDRSDYGRA